jgi:AAA domain, putative AbiEii toxin, Type IV TA system
VGTGREPLTVAKVRGSDRSVALKSLGEGANRFFGLAMAAASASNGVLLIDEVEIGIHYSIQLELWRVLAQVARAFNVQILATTHSEDAVREMPSLGVWLMPDNASEGMMETFASALVPAADACWAHARATVVGLPDTARRFDIDRCFDKASLHTWLAWQEESGRPDRIGGVEKFAAGRYGGRRSADRLDRALALGEFREPVTVQPAAGWGRCARKDKR